MDRLSETLVMARDAAVEEWEREHGATYMSMLEDYGDMVRKLEKIQASTKAVKSKLETISALMDNEDPQIMQERMADMETKAAAVLYGAARMYAAVRVMMHTIKGSTGGNLLDLLEDGADRHDG